MTFKKHDDGDITVDAFDLDATFSADFLKDAEPFVVVDWPNRLVHITCANGYACYRMTGEVPGMETYLARRIDVRMWDR